ncbi:chromosome segregation protein SMC, partial [Liquorilactobacillus satsumensis]|nr:chromosome segregation protein SMC [Liquorilactobacillus satsumensis]
QSKNLQADLSEQIDPKKIIKLIKESSDKQRALTTSLKTQKELVDRSDKQYDQLQNDIRNQQMHLNNATYELKNNREDFQNLQKSLDSSLNQLSHDFGILKSGLSHTEWNWDLETISRQIKLLRTGINEIGPVNISAIQEFQDVSDRY